MGHIYTTKAKKSIYEWRAVPENNEKHKSYCRDYARRKNAWKQITCLFNRILIDGY